MDRRRLRGCHAYNNCDDGAYPCGNVPDGKRCYYGRGAKQLSWNYNYGPFSSMMYGDKMTLLNRPDLVADTWLNLASAVFFFVQPRSPKPSMLDIIDGNWKPNNIDKEQNLSAGFGLTTHVINGGIECKESSESETAQARNRMKYYKAFAGYFNVSIPEDEVLGCAGMGTFTTEGAAGVPMYFGLSWEDGEAKCKVRPYDSGYGVYVLDDYINCVSKRAEIIVDVKYIPGWQPQPYLYDSQKATKVVFNSEAYEITGDAWEDDCPGASDGGPWVKTQFDPIEEYSESDNPTTCLSSKKRSRK